jgi:hypothetical protein
MDKQYPLIIVFYLDAEMMKIKDIIQPFVESVNHMLAHKNANALAFFLPTKGEERVECINPVIVKEADMEKINELVEDIKKNFSVGVDMEIADEEIIIDEPTKDCSCEGGECNC